MSDRAMSTWCRGASMGPDAWIARAGSLGIDAVALDATLTPAWLGGFGEERLRGSGAALRVIAIECPCPAPRTGRAPRLAAEDREERLAAIAAARETMRVATELGCKVIVARLGLLPIDPKWSRTTEKVAMRRLTKSDLRGLAAARVALSPRAIDLSRFALDPLATAAGEAGVTVALVNRARWFEIPDDAELGVLLEEFRGAPLATWIDPAAAHARAVVARTPETETYGALGARAAGAWLSDAAGLQGGLPWGRGEVDRAALDKALPEGALRIHHCAPGVTEEELASALTAATS